MTKKFVAFTMVEVLITIGIIGIVAALTIPTLISNYQKRAWTAQLKRSHAILNQGFRRMLADDNTSLLSQTETFQSIGGSETEGENGAKYRRCNYGHAINSANCNDFFTNLRKYFKIADIRKLTVNDKYKTYNLNGDVANSGYTYTAITLMDGTMIFMTYFYSQDQLNKTNNMMKGCVGYFYLDVNGLKRPNKYGRDIFFFYIGDNGIIYPVGSQAVSEYDSNGNKTIYYWATSKSSTDSCKNNLQSKGRGCTARVLETGKMDY